VSTYVQLRVAAEAYAISVGQVLRIAALGRVTAVPGSPPAVLGIRSLRGQILPVINFAALLGIGSQAPPGCLLVAEEGGRRGGLVIDEVSNVGELDDPTEETESGLLAGATFTGGQLVGIIDAGRVFDAVAGCGGE
jgi:chemotaxis signal transduction protein